MIRNFSGMWEIVSIVINTADDQELYPYGHSSFFYRIFTGSMLQCNLC